MSIRVITPPAFEPVSISDVMAAARIDTSNQEPSPSAPQAILTSGDGSVDNGMHRYCVTFVTDDGETQAGDVSSMVFVTDNSVSGKATLSSIQIGGNLVKKRRIYRTKSGQNQYLLLAEIGNNTDETYIDSIPDASLGQEAPQINTTGDKLLRLFIASARQYAEMLTGRYLALQTLEANYDCFACCFSLPSLQSVLSIKYIDIDGIERTMSSNYYTVNNISEPAKITLNDGFLWPQTKAVPNAVKITFTAGYASQSDVPEAIKDWILLRVKQRYDQGSMVNVGGSVTEFPRSYVDGILDPYRLNNFI